MPATKPTIIDDEEVQRLADMSLAVTTMENAFRARAAGTFVAPPRRYVSFPGLGRLVFTIGGDTAWPHFFGCRCQLKSRVAPDDHLTALWNGNTGSLAAVVIGPTLGEIRTGAIGGVAVKHMSRSDAKIAAVIGTGAHAAAQIAAVGEVRDIEEVRVFSRSTDHRLEFAEKSSERTGIKTVPTDTAEAAVADADIVVLATNSTKPVIQASWLKPGTHVNTLGPKGKRRSEIDPVVVKTASLVATDSPEQAAANDIFGSKRRITQPWRSLFRGRMVDLAEIVDGRVPARTDPDGITVFGSVGLAGSEVMLASAILERFNPTPPE